MNYARRTSAVFSTKEPVLTRKAMSESVASRKKFISEHVFSITVDPSTHEAKIDVEVKDAAK